MRKVKASSNKWGKDRKPDITEIVLSRGYYIMNTHVISSGTYHVTVTCYQTTNPPMDDVLASFPYATDSSSTTRFVVSQPKGIIRFVITQAVKSKDVTGALTMHIRARQVEARINARVEEVSVVREVSAIKRVDEVALLSKFTKKDLGDAQPLWVSNIPQVRGWSRDLTKEGVESTPGPSALCSFIVDRTQATRNNSYVEGLLVLVEPVLRNNPFSVLSLFESADTVSATLIDDEYVDESLAKKPALNGSSAARKVSTPSSRKSLPEPAQRGKPRARPDDRTTEDRAKQLAAVARRISEKLAKYDNPTKATVYWLSRHPPRKLVNLVLANLSLGGLEKTTLDAYSFAIFAYTHNMSCQDVFDSFCDAIDPTMIHSTEERAALFNDLFTVKPYIVGATRAHNKRMHALNGNIFVKVFTEIKDAPDWKTVVRAKPGVMSVQRHISDYETYFSLGPNITDLRDMDGMTSDYIGVDNLIKTGKTVRFAPSPLHPMAFYSSSSAVSIIRPNIGVPYVSAGLVEYRTNMFVDTTKCTEINTASTRFRPTDIDAAGFMYLDIANIARESIANSFSMEAPVMKWVMLSDILSLSNNHNIPRSIFMNIDGFVPHDPGSVNQVYGRNMNAITEIVEPNFPFVGGKGTIRFHLSLETVEARRRSSAVFVSPMIFQSSVNPQINLFLFTVGLVEWPFNIYTFNSSVKSPSNTEYIFDFIHRACLTRIPGPIDIDIILPRRTSEVKPRTNTEAIRLAQLCPVTTIDGVATVVTFTTEKSPQQDNDLSAYLDTYGPIVTQRDIYSFLSALNLKHNISNTVEVCHDLLASCVYTFPQLMDDTTSIHYPGSVAWDEDATAVGLRKLTDTASVWGGVLLRTAHRKAPWTDARKPTFQLFDFSYQSWNKVALGLAVSENTAPSPDCFLNPTIGMSKQVYWTVLKSMMLGITSQTTFAAIGLTSDAWDNAINTTQSEAIQNMARAMFCPKLSTGQLHPASMGNIFGAIHQHLFSVGLATVTYMSGGVPLSVTCFNRQILPSLFIKVLAGPIETRNIKDSGLYTPSFVSDVFVNVMTEKNLKFICNMLPSYAASGTMGFSNGLLPTNIPRSGEMGPYVDRDTGIGLAPVNETFALSDEHMWNNRLFMTSGVLKVVDHTTTVVDEQHGNINPRQRKSCGTWGIDITPVATDRTHTAGSCTLTFPSMTKHALLPLPVVGSDRRRSLFLAQQQCSHLARESWLLVGCLLTNSEANADGGDCWSSLLNSGFGQPASDAEEVVVNPRVQARANRPPEAELAPPSAAVADLVPQDS